MKRKKRIKLLRHNPQKQDYPDRVHKLLESVEKKHFWFHGRNRIIASYLKKYIKDPQNTNFLEIGCGNGFVLSLIERLKFKTTGVDMYLKALKTAEKRTKSASLICADILKDDFAKKFEVLGLFDILEHIEDQKTFLIKCRKFLKNEGLLFISVPADKKLWSIIDEVSGHKRRYSKESLREVVEKAGFRVKSISYYNFFLYLPLLLLRKVFDNKYRDKNCGTVKLLSDSFKTPFHINNIFKLIFYLEGILIKYMSFPIGGSLIAVFENVRNRDIRS